MTNQSRKYEFTGEVNSAGLKRIRAVRDIPRYAVKAGDLGGFLESEDNLSHEGSCWVRMNAWVSENARVGGDALICGSARVFSRAVVGGNAHVNGNCRIFGHAYVGENTQVSGNALVNESTWLCGNARIQGNAWVFGNAWVSGNARVFGSAQVSSPSDLLTITLDNIHITYIRGGYLTIGCQSNHIDDSFWDISDEDILEEFGEDYLRFVQAHGETILDMCIHLEEQANPAKKESLP